MNTLLRGHARDAFDAAVRRADPEDAVRAELLRAPLTSPNGGTTRVVALGKAAPAMLRAFVQDHEGPVETICITHRENNADVTADRLFRAGHPVPDDTGMQAAQAVKDLLNRAGSDDHVVALISGGGSALLPAPPDGVTLADKQVLNRLLLASGLDITAMNLIRQQVSDLKGGGFARLAAPAPVSALILSDVIGDDLRAIASGPTVAPIGTARDALALIQDVGIKERLPRSILEHLNRADHSATPYTPADNRLIGSNGQSVAAAAQALSDRYHVTVADTPLVGDLHGAAMRVFHEICARASKEGPQALIWSGETTVRLTGSGLGGRNQELALRVAALADAQPIVRPWVFLSGGTDGRDGPTDSAGAIVDQGTCDRIFARGKRVADFLHRNDSYPALALSGDHLMTGATGTNVADIQIGLIR